ncbi:DUF998 domain-containing protein [Glycomyces buryatensis]|uniref:DUF998 domain-containing protein n=1 Tax=Glycomyces buryatensis TaxID=2570927 RepID=A0A4S8QCU6_9ACTN|nr:DUF998 domain-containing protein [Glycomyces buryatensis]THV42188.1 DUF998 domain-containing protein [Glycomyces buryatensis]
MNRELFQSRAAGLVAFAAVAVCIAGFAVMHLTQSDVVNPVATPVSSYALTFPGIVLFPLSCLSLALACTILAGRSFGLAREGFIRFLLGATAVMLVFAAAFRTGTPETGLTWGAQIHRYTAGAAFVLLTVVAVLCAAQMRAAGTPDVVRRATWWAAALASLTFATTTVNTFLPRIADGGDWRGIPQRVLLVVLAGLVLALISGSQPTAAPVPAPVRVPARAAMAMAASRRPARMASPVASSVALSRESIRRPALAVSES